MNRIMLLTLSSLLLVFLNSCDPSRKYEKEETQQIEDYLRTLGDSAVVPKPSGLYYIELVKGTGLMPVKSDTVAFRYKGTFLSGQLFDSNYALDSAYAFILGSGEIIPGIDEGISYMKVGGKARLLTPSRLAYGSAGIWGVLPGYTPLLWEIVLVSVKPAKK